MTWLWLAALVVTFNATIARAEPPRHRVFEISRADLHRYKQAWLTGTEGACERPGLYEHLRLVGRIKGRSIDTLCPGLSVVTERGEIVPIDFARLKNIQYLVAGQGNTWASRFGHAMLRLTFCAPNAPLPCEADDFYALDLGFAAQSDRLRFTLTGGITGRYPSLLIANADTDLRTRYTHAQLRDVRAYNLKLSAEQRLALAALLVEKFWVHQSTYRFLTNNCADEVLNILASIVPRAPNRSSLDNVPREFLTPGRLRDFLLDRGLLETKGPSWISDRRPIEARLREISTGDRSRVTDVQSYVRIPARERRVLIERAPDPHARLIYVRLEELAVKMQTEKVTHAAVEAMYAGKRASCKTDRAELIRSLESRAAAINKRHLTRDGRLVVPSLDDLASSDELLLRRRQLATTISHIVRCYDQLPAVRAAQTELRDARENLVYVHY